MQSPWLLSLVTSRIDRLEDQVDGTVPDADLAVQVVAVAPKLLGAEGPQRFLVFFTTPVEARGRLGFPGNYAELVVDNGQLSMPVFGRVAELEAAGSNRTLSQPADLVARYSRFDVANTWRNLTMTPDFPSFAMAANELYQQSGGQPVNGVISVDPAGLAAVVGLTGEVAVPGRAEPLTADTVEDFLLSGQYIEYQDDNDAAPRRARPHRPHLVRGSHRPRTWPGPATSAGCSIRSSTGATSCSCRSRPTAPSWPARWASPGPSRPWPRTATR